MHDDLNDDASSPPLIGLPKELLPRAPRRTWPRRLARICVRPLARTGVSPNQITILRAVIGGGAAALLGTGTETADRAAAALWLLAMFLDRCDGEFARMTGRTSALGHRLDYLADLVVSALFFIGTGIGARHGVLGWWAVGIGVVAAAGVVTAQILAEAIDKRQADRGEKAFPGVTGFDFEDALLLFAPLVWMGWHVWFVAAASVGAPLFALFTLLLLRRSRRATGPARAT